MSEGRLRYDLNADVGEGFPYDAELMAVITSANVACGFHAGDAATMRQLCEWCVERNVAVGAQFSYRDREGFGRRDVDVTRAQLEADLTEQVEALTDAAHAAGAIVSYVKPHGALYNRAVWDDERSAAVAAVAGRFGLPVLALPGSRLAEQAVAAGLATYREFFADRAYDGHGRLVPRSEPESVLTDPGQIVERIRQLVTEGTVTTVDETLVSMRADSICVHGDTPDALGLARSVRGMLEGLGAVVTPCS